MDRASHRVFKNRLYGLFARIGKALSSPHRLEMLELLAQGERTVDSLASEMGVSVANASQHLQALRQAALVESRKDGLFVHYRLAAPGVFELSKAIRTVAEDRLADLDRLVREHFAERDDADAVPMSELLKRARSREIVILDARPASEYAAGHIPGAISVPVEELNHRLKQLPKGKEYVAYCRGPYLRVRRSRRRSTARKGTAGAALEGRISRVACRGTSGRCRPRARSTAMIFRPYYYYDLGCAAYVFGCGTLGTGAVVDARADDIDSYIEFASAKGLRLTHIIDTHVHADHRSGGPELARRVGAQYCIHEAADVTYAFTALHDGDQIELGNTHVKVLHTPGHSPESVCLLVTDLKRGADPWFVLTGDTLFVGAVGRPDLPGRARENAARLYASLHEKLLNLPDDLEIYPGHFSGSVCGAGLSGKPMTTLGFEKRWNPMLRLEREAFIEKLADVPAKPVDMERVLAFNRGHEAVSTP